MWPAAVSTWGVEEKAPPPSCQREHPRGGNGNDNKGKGKGNGMSNGNGDDATPTTKSGVGCCGDEDGGASLALYDYRREASEVRLITVFCCTTVVQYVIQYSSRIYTGRPGGVVVDLEAVQR